MAGSAAVGMGVALGGCAHRAPAAPPEPKRPVQRLALLPVTFADSNEGTRFGYVAPAPVVVVPLNAPGRPVTRGSVGAAIGVGVVAGLIGYAVEQKRQSDRQALMAALAAVQFDPAGFLDARLPGALAERQIAVHAINDAATGYAVRAYQFDALPPDVDAYLDVTVRDSGYYSSMRAGGYSPVLQIDARVVPVPLRADGDDLDSFGYYADWRNGGKDPRWITTPASLTMASLDQLKAESASVRAALQQLTAQFVQLMVQDVQRVVLAQPRVD